MSALGCVPILCHFFDAEISSDLQKGVNLGTLSTASRIKDFFCCETKERYFYIGKIIGPFISLFLLFLVFIIVKGSIYLLFPVVLGFSLAAGRSYLKEWRLLKRKKVDEKDLTKPLIDMVWTYLVNYTIVLSSIYILGSYILDKKGHPGYIIWTILFLLSYFVDFVFDIIKDSIRGFIKRLWS